MLGMKELNKVEVDEKSTKATLPGNSTRDEGFETLIKRVINFSLLMVLLGSFTIFLVGSSSLGIKSDIDKGESFIKTAEEMRPNFEDSLLLYTGNTQKIIDYLLKLRPRTEEDFISFITSLEKIGKELFINLEIKTIEDKDKVKDRITYNVNFYGSIDNLKAFIKALDQIPYYVKISDIKYSNPIVEDGKDVNAAKIPNISIELQLFTKTKNAN